ncbi:MAG: c-type cytochrome [Armatimonadota bacterium]|nr:c-type cytochrome [Armatimonadota bacterium]
MAQDRNTGAGTTPADPTQTSPEDRGGSRFHVYAGGEVKELEGTRVSPWLWGFWTIVIIGAVGYFLVGGALGPQAGMGFKPGDASTVSKTQMETELAQAKLGTYTALDVAALPHPAGQTTTQAIAAGQNVYETYCIGCHGQNRDGNGVNAGSLNPKPRNLIDGPFMQSMSYQRVYTSLHKGVPGTAMPRWENLLSEKELQDAAIYVLSLTAPKPGAAAAASTTSMATPVENTGSAPPVNTGKTPALPKPGHPVKPVGPHKNLNGSTTNTAGGSTTYGSGVIQDSPKPITPAINGNPAADTQNAPPSQSAPNSDSTPNAGANPSPTRSGAGAPIPGGTAGVMHNTPGNTVTPGAGM